MPAIRYKVHLSDEEKRQLEVLVHKGKSAARSQTRARILLKAAAGVQDKDIIQALDVSPSTVAKTRQRCVEEGPEAALKERPRPGQAPKLTDKQAAHLIAIACSEAPEGHSHWTLRLLADKVVELDYAASCSYELIRRLLKKHFKTWQKQEWCLPDVSAEFVAAMEDVLDLYEEPYDPTRPVVCFDESPKQLIAEVREPIPVEPGAPARYDTGYERKGVCELMMICEPKRGFRHVDVTDRRTKIDFAHSMQHVAELYPEASVIRVVLDNLNTHKMASLYEAFPAEQARHLARKLEFHYTPKHGSWLNSAEIELAVLANSCLSQRIPDQDTLRRAVEANVRERNLMAIPINWRFTTQDARRKLARLYPCASS